MADPEPRLDELASSVRIWSGNILTPLELTLDELRSAARRGEPIIASWRRDGVLLAGQPLAQLLGDTGAAA